jgi:uncharacterized FAD-dependent dehydrogenase
MAEKKSKYKLKIINLRCPVEESTDLYAVLDAGFSLNKDDIVDLIILRRSTDARKDSLYFVYTLVIDVLISKVDAEELLENKNVEKFIEKSKRGVNKISCLKNRPVIIGCGPAGIFAAITLVERGVAPIVIERGERVVERVKSINKFWNFGELNPESNMFYGEGGAGTFSDGKLTTRIKSDLKDRVLREFIDAGAENDIAYISRPHLGTDCLRKIIPNIIEKLISKGVDFLFNTKVNDIIIEQGRVKGVLANNNLINTENIFLAVGHSSFEVYNLLKNKSILLEPKGFAVGFRIEHPREFIDSRQHGKFSGNKYLGAADYYLAYKDKKTGKGVYSFCMCPGGYVVGCSSSNDTLCTNGMSKFARENDFSNSAIVVSISPDDLEGDDPLKGFSFIHQLEKSAYELGGGNFSAPVQNAVDFMNSNISDTLIRDTSYRPMVKCSDLNHCFDDRIASILKRGLKDFNNKIPGFIDEGILLGVETRTSSPARIVRDKTHYSAVGIKGLFPIGEASGYAGGIMSCAVDGIKAAEVFC